MPRPNFNSFDLHIQTRIELACFQKFQKTIHNHPNNRIRFGTQCNTTADLVLELIKCQGLQYQHPNTALALPTPHAPLSHSVLAQLWPCLDTPAGLELELETNSNSSSKLTLALEVFG
jgi:hypothetical protein